MKIESLCARDGPAEDVGEIKDLAVTTGDGIAETVDEPPSADEPANEPLLLLQNGELGQNGGAGRRQFRLEDGRMTLIGHLTELWNRLGIAIAAFFIFLLNVAPLPGTTSNSFSYQVFVCSATGRNFTEKGGGRMIFTALHEGFFTQIMLAFYIALHYFSYNLHAIGKFIVRGCIRTSAEPFCRSLSRHLSVFYWVRDGLLL